ncbi:Uncharacterized membrane protein YczE [Clostridium sp. DSM 8431]|uniref:YczE/YyaS/YitT family protein n=1 Tax=Clostridium sp. DSM 8431 TaxID=1761781 RepID=UPI0008E659D4|nr:hypothetical protein [Clostridium sp. DSM 8431]SFU88432.1 Uncharacterized membrane protein YczE [Clostridium sp. DSM 8431]
MGLFIVQAGVTLFLSINIGSDPFTVFTQGLSKLLNITPGNSNRLITFILLILLTIFYRKVINIGTILAMIFAGPFLDRMLNIYSSIPFEAYSFPLRIILFFVASVIIAIVFPILKAPSLGVAPNDSVYLAFSELFHKPYGIVRIFIDAIFLILGFIFGGIVGVGTIICLASLGPIMGFFLKILEPIISPYVNN